MSLRSYGCVLRTLIHFSRHNHVDVVLTNQNHGLFVEFADGQVSQMKVSTVLTFFIVNFLASAATPEILRSILVDRLCRETMSLVH
jgi:hypothetical protein